MDNDKKYTLVEYTEEEYTKDMKELLEKIQVDMPEKNGSKVA